jgi:hypothetical protein
MCAAKIRLSKKEEEMMRDAELILTKNRTLQEWIGFFARWQEERVAALQEQPLLIDAWTRSAPKISRGENYRGLPWVVLDYPRASADGRFAALRFLFWWGRHVSLTLHVAGEFKTALEPRLLEARSGAVENGWRLCVGDDEWQHHDEAGYYEPAHRMTDTQWRAHIREKSFCKLAVFFPLEEWEALPDRGAAQWEALLKLVRV